MMKYFLETLASSTVEVCVYALVVVLFALPTILCWGLVELNVIQVNTTLGILTIIIQVIWIRTGYKMLLKEREK